MFFLSSHWIPTPSPPPPKKKIFFRQALSASQIVESVNLFKLFPLGLCLYKSCLGFHAIKLLCKHESYLLHFQLLFLPKFSTLQTFVPVYNISGFGLPWNGVSGWDLSTGPLNIHFNNNSAFIWGIQFMRSQFNTSITLIFRIGYDKDTLYDG